MESCWSQPCLSCQALQVGDRRGRYVRMSAPSECSQLHLYLLAVYEPTFLNWHWSLATRICTHAPLAIEIDLFQCCSSLHGTIRIVKRLRIEVACDADSFAVQLYRHACRYLKNHRNRVRAFGRHVLGRHSVCVYTALLVMFRTVFRTESMHTYMCPRAAGTVVLEIQQIAESHYGYPMRAYYTQLRNLTNLSHQCCHAKWRIRSCLKPRASKELTSRVLGCHFASTRSMHRSLTRHKFVAAGSLDIFI